jgi:hypothetical protein
MSSRLRRLLMAVAALALSIGMYAAPARATNDPGCTTCASQCPSGTLLGSTPDSASLVARIRQILGEHDHVN